jgi:hypothetical protein
MLILCLLVFAPMIVAFDASAQNSAQDFVCTSQDSISALKDAESFGCSLEYSIQSVTRDLRGELNRTPSSEEIEQAIQTRNAFDVFVNRRRDILAKVLLDAKQEQADPTKQPNTPSIASNPTSLVEKGSVGDFLTLALQHAGISSNTTDNTVTSATASLLQILALIDGADINDPEYLNNHKKWRRLSFTIGKDSPEGTAAGNAPEGAIYGIKWIISEKERDNKEVDAAWEALKPKAEAVAAASAILMRASRQALIDMSIRNGNKLITIEGGETETTTTEVPLVVLRNLNDTQRLRLDQAILSTVKEYFLDAYKSYRVEVSQFQKVIPNFRRLTFDMQTKQLKGGGKDDYQGTLIYEWARGKNSSLTTNLAYLRKTDAGGSNTGAKLGLEYLRLRVPPKKNRTGDTDDKKEASPPQRFTIGVIGDTSGTQNIGKIQLQYVIPISRGIEIPISLTAANRTEFINEGKVKGKIGFTVDLSKVNLLKMFDPD